MMPPGNDQTRRGPAMRDLPHGTARPRTRQPPPCEWPRCSATRSGLECSPLHLARTMFCPELSTAVDNHEALANALAAFFLDRPARMDNQVNPGSGRTDVPDRRSGRARKPREAGPPRHARVTIDVQ